MELIRVLSSFVWKGDVQGNLVNLVHYRSVAGNHFAYVKLEHTRNGLQLAMHASDQFICGFGVFRFGPENDNV